MKKIVYSIIICLLVSCKANTQQIKNQGTHLSITGNHKAYPIYNAQDSTWYFLNTQKIEHNLLVSLDMIKNGQFATVYDKVEVLPIAPFDSERFLAISSSEVEKIVLVNFKTFEKENVLILPGGVNPRKDVACSHNGRQIAVKHGNDIKSYSLLNSGKVSDSISFESTSESIISGICQINSNTVGYCSINSSSNLVVSIENSNHTQQSLSIDLNKEAYQAHLEYSENGDLFVAVNLDDGFLVYRIEIANMSASLIKTYKNMDCKRLHYLNDKLLATVLITNNEQQNRERQQLQNLEIEVEYSSSFAIVEIE